MSHFTPRDVAPVLPPLFSYHDVVNTPVDLFPTELLEELGIEAQQVEIAPSRRCPRVPRRFAVAEKPQIIEKPKVVESKPMASLACFEVTLSDGNTVAAFSIYEFHGSDACGVVVRDGQFLRYGKITRQIGQEESANSPYQIVMFDNDGSLGRHIKELSEVVSAMMPVFVYGTGLAVCETEIVSFRARSLLRVRVTGYATGNVETLTERLISTFAMAVEIYE